MAPALLGWCGRAGAAGAPIRGVAPEAQERYGPGSTFTCSSGERVPYEAINDDFCDCADGGDEPGTGACAGQDVTLFHCENKGSVPQLIYSSRVDDGICDCCDGSDEGGLAQRRAGAAACADGCEEEGRLFRRRRDERIRTLKAGLKTRAEIEARARSDRERWSADLDRLNGARPSLEAALQKAKLGAAAPQAAAGDGTAELRRELTDLRETVRRQQDEMRSLRRDVDALREALGKEGGASAAAADTEAKVVVSEYAKWMDGAGDEPGAADEAPPKAAEEDEGDDGRPPSHDQGDAAEASDPADGWLSSLRAGVGRVFTRLSGGSAVDKARQRVDGNKHEAAELTKKLERLIRHADADHSGFASLADTCLEKKDSQYTYKLCFFDAANQGSVELGRWSGWTGPREARFDGGDECWGGPARELRVVFRCGSTEEVHEVTEPSRCSYEVHISHPGACDAKDEAALLAPSVRRPGDEL